MNPLPIMQPLTNPIYSSYLSRVDSTNMHCKSWAIINTNYLHYNYSDKFIGFGSLSS